MSGIIIVGAGISGLTAAAYLVKEGKKVTILEKSSDVGGLVHTFDYRGYKFDTGPKAIENSGMVQPMLKDLGIELEMRKSRVSWGIGGRITSLNSLEDVENVKSLILELYPDDSRDIERIFRRIDRAIKLMERINRVDNPFLHSPVRSIKYLLFTILPWLPLFLLTLLELTFWSKPMEFSLKRRVKNPSLRDILTQHYFKATPESFALGYFHTFTDYYYPKGGTGSLPKVLAQYIRERDGEIVLDTAVEKIDIERKTLTVGGGQILPYNKLIWSADEATWSRVSNIPNKERVRTGESVFSIFIGVRVEPEVFGGISNGHLIYTPSTTGLGELHRAVQDDLVEHITTKSREEVFTWVEEFCRRNTYEIAIPSLREDGMSPKGSTGVIISLLVDGRLFQKVSDLGWYDEFTEHMKGSMLQTLNDTIYPFLLESIEFSKVASPLTLEHMFGVKDGSITGWSLESYKASSLMSVLKSVRTPYKGHFRVGQWTYSPAGVPIAILTGRLAAKEVLLSEL